jgi:hypothetical protein
MKTPQLLILILVLLCISPFCAKAQRFEDLTNKNGDNAFTDRGIHIFVRYTGVNAKYTESYGGFTFNGSFRIDRLEKGEVSYHFENPTLGDLIWLLFNISKMDGRDTEQAYGSGFFGWHQVYWNVVSEDRLLISPGVSFGDYIYSAKRAGESPNVLDPSGYFFHLGPAFKTSYVISNDLWLDGILNYDIGFRAGKPGGGNYLEKKGYQKPHFLTLGGTINHVPTRLFGSVRINQLIDRGENKDSATRLDVSFGFMF